MKIIYTRKLEGTYPANPVESPYRVMLPSQELQCYEFVEPIPACFDDIARVHSKDHIARVKRAGLFDAASLSAGGAVVAAELALKGEPAFALIRPPGHHASATRSWGMCYFNNMAIAIQKIRPLARRVLIIDIDLHFGDGTVSIFRGDKDIKVVNPGSVDINFDYLNMDSLGYMRQIEEAFLGFEFDLVGVSAGFDTYVEDWGGLISRDEYQEIGRIIRDGADRCDGRRFALLEGGYHADLRYNIKSFLAGFK